MALALIIMPVVVRTTENMMRLVPDSLREAAAALGAPSWKIVRRDRLSQRAARHPDRRPAGDGAHRGETAPLLFTALNNQFWSTDMCRAVPEPAGRDLSVRDESV